MRGVTRGYGEDEIYKVVSIHTPHAGCDIEANEEKMREKGFNPHTPCGV